MRGFTCPRRFSLTLYLSPAARLRPIAHSYPPGQVMFQCLPAGEGGQLALPIGDITAVPSRHAQMLTFAKLDIFVGLYGEQIKFDYMTELFDPATIDRIKSSYIAALEIFASRPTASPWTMNIFSAAEQEEVARLSCGSIRPDYLAGPLVHEAFEARAALHPGRRCLVFEGGEMSFGEANTAADAVAAALTGMGIATGSIVGIMLDRSFDLVVGILGVLKAGGEWAWWCWVVLPPG